MIFKSILSILMVAFLIWASNLSMQAPVEPSSPKGAIQAVTPEDSLSGEQRLYVKAIVSGYKTSKALAEEVVKVTWEEATLQGIDPVLVLKVIAQESKFVPDVISPSGDIGLMQINTHWKKDEIRRAGGIHKAMVVKTNLKIGIKALADSLKQEQTLHEGLRRYNGLDKPKGVYASQVLKHSALLEGFRASI